MSVNCNITFLEKIKQGFQRTNFWNRYRSKIITQAKNNNLDYLIDPALRNINILFVVLFKNGKDDPARCYFDKYSMQLVEIKF